MKAILQNIAKQILRIDTLETRNSDSLDFYNRSVWLIKDALKEAYKAGQKKPLYALRDVVNNVKCIYGNNCEDCAVCRARDLIKELEENNAG